MSALKRIRLKKGLTQQQLADILGIRQPDVCKYERRGLDRSPAVIVWAFSEKLEVPVGELLSIAAKSEVA